MSAPAVAEGQEWSTPLGSVVCKVLRVQAQPPEKGDGEEAVLEDVVTGDIAIGDCETLQEMWRCVR